MTASGDRHLRPDPAGLLPRGIAGGHAVTVVAEPGYASTFAGQALLGLLVDLLARQFKVLGRVELDIPSVRADRRAVGALPGEDLETALLRVGQAAAGSEIAVSTAGSNARNVVFVGPGRSSRPGASLAVTVVADSWSATVSDRPLDASDDSDDLPFGPHLAATLAADRVFRGLHGLDVSGMTHIELLTPSERDEASARLVGLRLPPGYLVGLGAVGAAFLLTLRCAGIPATIIGIDPDPSDVTSRNRLLSMAYDQVGVPKTDLAAALITGSAVEFYPNEVAWPAYYGQPERQRPNQLAELERDYQFEWMISAVDKNVARRNIASILPRHVLTGATNGFVAQAAYMAMEGNCECLACNHPIPSFDIDAVRDELRGLDPAERSQRLLGIGASDDDLAAIDAYLDDPDCGTVGEATLRRLGIEGGVDWAVGHVSAAGGVLLAAEFARAVMFGPAALTTAGAERRIIFWGRPDLIESQARRKPDCPVCGDPARQATFADRWRS